MKFDYEIEDVITDLEDVDEVFVEISKEITKQLFNEADDVPRNADGEEDHSYVWGELQFMFLKGTNNLCEILLFTVFEDEYDEGTCVGDFTNAPNSVYDYKELIADVIKAKNGVS